MAVNKMAGCKLLNFKVVNGGSKWGTTALTIDSVA